jgi:biopolymer transport protein ExbB
MPTTLPFAFLMGQSPMELFGSGGPIMWRTIFLIRENFTREPEAVEKMLEYVEARDTESAVALGRKSKDYVARILVYALTHKEHSLANAFMRAANHELTRFQQGMAWLDTCITAAPLLGLLGTVTGMMNTFGALGGGGDIAANAGKITGGVGEALIATAFGLIIAILGLFPYNVLNARIDAARHDISDASNTLEVIIKKAAATCLDCPSTSRPPSAVPAPRA